MIDTSTNMDSSDRFVSDAGGKRIISQQGYKPGELDMHCQVTLATIRTTRAVVTRNDLDKKRHL